MCLTVSGCSGFPKLHPRYLRISDNACVEYSLKEPYDPCHITFEKPVEHPLIYCDKNYALPEEDVKALRVYQAGQCANQ